MLAQSLLVDFIEGRRAFHVVSAFARGVLFKAPQSLSGLGLMIFNFTRKPPSDVFSGGMPARATISSIQGDSDLKAYFSRRKLAEVCLAFDFENGMNTAGGHFYF